MERCYKAGCLTFITEILLTIDNVRYRSLQVGTHMPYRLETRDPIESWCIYPLHIAIPRNIRPPYMVTGCGIIR
jgi:hypothetical protein